MKLDNLNSDVKILMDNHKCDAIWENPPHGENLTFGVISII